MHALIVEDNAFNAFCLTRLLQDAYPDIEVSVVDGSLSAYNFLCKRHPSLVILDGELRNDEEWPNNGPALAQLIWSQWPELPIIGWTNSEVMQQAFDDVFKRHKRIFNENYCF